MDNKKSTKSKLDKSTKNNKYNPDIINLLIDKYGFKKNYIEKIIRGERTGIIPIRIQEEYRELERVSRLAIEKKANTLKKVELT